MEPMAGSVQTIDSREKQEAQPTRDVVSAKSPGGRNSAALCVCLVGHLEQGRIITQDPPAFRGIERKVIRGAEQQAQALAAD